MHIFKIVPYFIPFIFGGQGRSGVDEDACDLQMERYLTGKIERYIFVVDLAKS